MSRLLELAPFLWVAILFVVACWWLIRKDGRGGHR